jgi:hypothetical protein
LLLSWPLRLLSCSTTNGKTALALAISFHLGSWSFSTSSPVDSKPVILTKQFALMRTAQSKDLPFFFRRLCTLHKPLSLLLPLFAPPQKVRVPHLSDSPTVAKMGM